MYPFVYISPDLVEARPEFLKWFWSVRDAATRGRVIDRVARLANGNPGDFKMIDRNLFELRLHFGPGYRLYYARRGEIRVLLLAGGDKWSQPRDIVLARTLRDGEGL